MEWRRVPIEQVALVNPRNDDVRALDDQALVSFVPMQSVSEETASITVHETRTFAEGKRGYTPFREGDVLFAKITPCMENGKIAIARRLTNGIGFGSTEFHVLRAGPAVLPEYLYYYLRQESLRAAAKQHMRGGAGQQRVPEDFLRKEPLPLPPLSEQRRIVEILDQADRLRRLRAEADAKADRILPALFIKMFGDPATNPMGWPTRILGSLAEIVTGNTPSTEKPEYYGSDFPWARPADLDTAPVVTTTERMLSNSGRAVARVIPAGSTLVVCIGATLGKVGLAGREMAINQQINALLPSNALANEFVFTQCTLIADRFRDSATKSTLPILNKSKFSAQRIIVPPLKLQEQFAARAREYLRIHGTRSRSAINLGVLFSLLISRAFSGALTASWREAHMKELLQEMEQQARILEAVKG